MAGGRPTIYSDELAETICNRIIDGQSLRKICLADDMPNRDTIHHWLATKSQFSDQYAKACRLRRENKFEELEEIASTEPDVQRARLKIDVVKWQLSKEEPKKYGDKLEVDNHHSGEVSFINDVPRPTKSS